jgi:hypothetical protein
MTTSNPRDELAAMRTASERRTEPALHRLPPHTIACATCGVACTGGERESVTVSRIRVDLGRCYGCTDLDRQDVAAQVLGLDRAALCGVHPGPLAALRYAAHAKPDHAAATPWSHLTRAALGNARRAVVLAQRRRILACRPPVHVAPPTLDCRPGDVDGGCLLCGVGTVPVAALNADGHDPETLALRTWRHTITSGLTPTTVRGWLCPTDAALLAEEGAMGVSLVARSMRHAGLLEGDGLPARLPSWAWLVMDARRRGQPSPPANAKRWDHVPTAIRLVPSQWPPPLAFVEQQTR